jgi:flagellar biosynthesis/type III secretory pathway chaperone
MDIQENSKESQEIVREEEPRERYVKEDEHVDDILPQKKLKRVMTEKQKENLVKARLKAAQLRNELKSKKPLTRQLSKLEKELETLKEKEDVKVKEEPREPRERYVDEDKEEIKVITPVVKKQYELKKIDGFLYMV